MQRPISDMTSLRNISVSDSAVYRNIHHKPQEEPLLVGGATDEETSKWAFLKRLLEIEEAHDKRRKARERQERALKQAMLKPLTKADDMVQPAPQKPEVDHSAQWLSGQVNLSSYFSRR